MSTPSDLPPPTRIQTTDGANDPYDHAISLIDTTVPAENEARERSSSPGFTKLVKNPTKGSMREQLARRKYAKWQEDRYFSKEDNVVMNQGEVLKSPTKPKDDTAEPQDGHPQDSETDVADFAHQEGDTGRGRKGKSAKQHHHKRRSEQAFEVDILYENQRGWFFFGIPLYSHSSLLNFDPSPWVTKDFKDSPVNITNAQVPDPSWVWSWKRWYVDMSYDVDEQGWQYSFSFSRRVGNFSWHGTHPWFHSFVRRRRWLRKRVKRHDLAMQGKSETMKAAHQLTSDYFTIHPKREKSPGSYLEEGAKTARPDSYLSIRTDTDVEEPPDDIKDIPSMFRALRFTKIDREKIDIVMKFVEQGGEELAYLVENIPKIMSFMIFQNSRRQLLLLLKETARDAQKHREEHDAEDNPESKAERQRIDHLLSAVEAADGEVRDLEYWSDRKDVLKMADDVDGRSRKSKSSVTGLDDNPVDKIQGIPNEAEIEFNESFLRSTSAERPPESAESKGKGKAVDLEDGQKEHEDGAEEPQARLKFDQVLIPDD